MLILSSAVPVPTVFIAFSTEYWAVIAQISKGILTLIQELNQESSSAKQLSEEVDHLRKIISQQIEQHNTERGYLQDLKKEYDEQLS